MTILLLPELRRLMLNETSTAKLAKSLLDTPKGPSWTAFLSYRTPDRTDAVRAAKAIQRSLPDLSIYVDYEDARVGSLAPVALADQLRAKIEEVDLLIVVVSSESPESKWIPWELGLADGKRKKVAVLPCTDRPLHGDGLEFNGQEYLGLYPWLDIHKAAHDGRDRVWANTKRDTYVEFEAWMDDTPPRKHAR